MDVLVYGIQSPLVMSKINCSIRFISIATAVGIPINNITNYDPGVVVNVDYLEQEYIPYLYPYHSIDKHGLLTIHPLIDKTVDEIKDSNFFEIMMKIYRYSKIIFSKC